ncbi:MAG: transcription termination factor NusA [Lachnospiraceae bacterium]|nr:transcription termination factor NusA [Lachnospiraceae bacterium]
MSEIIDALNQLEKEKSISKDVIMDAIEKSLESACEKDFGKDAIIEVSMDRTTGDIAVFQKKIVVEEVTNEATEISFTQAQAMSKKNKVGDEVKIEIKSKEFGRIAAQKARSIIVQSIKEGEREALYNKFHCKKNDIITGVVQRNLGNNLIVSLDEKTETVLSENEQVKGEVYKRGDRIKLYVVEVKLSTEKNAQEKDKNPKGKKDKNSKGFKILVSRTHPELVKRLFEKEVTEVADGTVEIKSISREAGSRTKIAVWSNNPDVDPVGACVGLNGTRVNNIVDDLKGEKIDIITWSEDPAKFIENALSPSKVISVELGEETDEKGKPVKCAYVVVPDYQLSLAIGKEGQNARLAAKLTGYKIDIKSESKARELGMEFDSYDEDDDYYEDSYEDEE